MSTYPIFPSLSRAPDFATSRKIDDGTLSDPKESGYVSTRPRFTRLRRAWSVAWKNLTEEDVRALDQFEVSVVKGGAGAFYLPNLLANGGFELYEADSYGATTFDGWASSVQGHGESIGVASPGSDGAASAVFSSVAGYSLPVGGGNLTGNLATLTQGAVSGVGDALLFFARVYVVPGALSASVSVTAQPYFSFSNGAQIYAPSAPTASGFSDYEYAFSAPAGTSLTGIGLLVFFTNNTAAPVILDGSAKAYWDQCGLAITTAAQPYGRMVGSSSPGSPVRFTKGLEIKDAKPADGVKRYDATCEVTEL